jgi:hypothetical protein
VLRKIERRQMLENEENEEQIAKPVFRAAGAPVAGQSTEKTKRSVKAPPPAAWQCPDRNEKLVFILLGFFLNLLIIIRI